jgi:AcrR family transcriptional regulator
MYHHFAGKSDLALEAVKRSASELRTAGERQLSSPGTAIERISRYLLREREVLRGCRIGRLTQDPEVVTDPVLRAPVEETFTWLQGRLEGILVEGQAAGELDENLDAASTASAIAAVLQGGYVLARAANSVEPFDRAVHGLLALLARAAITASL